MSINVDAKGKTWKKSHSDWKFNIRVKSKSHGLPRVGIHFAAKFDGCEELKLTRSPWKYSARSRDIGWWRWSYCRCRQVAGRKWFRLGYQRINGIAAFSFGKLTTIGASDTEQPTHEHNRMINNASNATHSGANLMGFH